MSARPLATHPGVFWTRVDVSEPDACWPWKMSTQPSGYGQTWDGKRVLFAHRVAYELAVGPIPEGLVLDHLCRNRRCVNPAHLEPVTDAENIRRATVLITHCPHGHEYAPENTYIDGKGWRRCRTCQRSRNAEAKAAKIRASKVGRVCAGCNAPLPVEFKSTAKWCSQTCRAKTRWREERR